MVVTVELAGDPMTFLLGSREASVDDDLEVYSATSPLGAAIIGKKAGDSTSYTSPNGKSFDVKVLSTKPYAG
jgi:transcription elongation factor GreA